MGDIELTTAALTGSVLLLLPIQLLLCFKVKRLGLRLLPPLLFLLLTLIFIGKAAGASDWEGLGYGFLAALSGLMTLVCGAAWGIWRIVRRMQKKRGN